MYKITSEMLTPDMKLVIIMNQIGALKNPAKSIGIAINPINMRNATNNIFHEVPSISFSAASWRFSVRRRG